MKAGQTWNYAASIEASATPVVRTVTDPASHQRVYRFSNASRLGVFTDEMSNTTTYAYDNPTTIASLHSVTLPGTDIVTYGYDSRYNVTSITRSPKPGMGVTASITTSATYPSSCSNVVTCNKPITTTDERGKVTSYSYDATHGGVTQVVAPADSAGSHPTTNYGYTALYAWYKNSAGALVQATTPIYMPTMVSQCQTNPSCASGSSDEARTTIAYEAGSSGTKSNLLPVSVSRGSGASPAMSVVTSGYDMFGNVTSVDGPLSGTADTARIYYNTSRQQVGAVSPDPDGGGALKPRAVRVTYRTDGQVDHVDVGTVNNPTDNPSGLTVLQTTTPGYDGYARPTRKTLSAGGTTYAVQDTSFDALGRVNCTAQRMNLASLPSDACTAGTAGSNGPDRITHAVYNYDSSVNKVQTAYGTALQRDYVSYTYTPNGKVQTLADAKGNLTTYEYDAYDRLTKARFPNPSGGGSSTSDYEQLTLDNAGNVTQRRLRDGQLIGFSYDDLGRLTFKDRPGSEPDVYYGYDLLNRTLYARYGSASGNGVTNSFDALGQQTATTSDMGGTARTLSYQYDAAGNRTRITHPDSAYFASTFDMLSRYVHSDWWTSATGTVPFVAVTYDDLGRRADINRASSYTGYGYDGASRLTSQNQRFAGGAGNLNATFGYNPAGQITSRTQDNDAFAFQGYFNVNRGYTTNGLNQYTAAGAASFTYDARGNLTSDGTTSFTYDSENRLVSTSAGVQLAYDPLGRLWRTWGGAFGKTDFVYDGDQLAVEYDGDTGAMRRRYMFAGTDEPILWDEGSALNCSATRFLHTDERGSVTALADCSGNRVAVNSYDEYGIPAAANFSPSLRQRFQYTGQAWIPELGMYYYKARMYSPTLGRFMQTDPIGYGDGPNWYDYVGGDPINRADSSGMSGNPPQVAPPVDIQVTGHRQGPKPPLDPGCHRLASVCSNAAVAAIEIFALPPCPDPEECDRINQILANAQYKCELPTNVNIDGTLTVSAAMAGVSSFSGTLTDVSSGLSIKFEAVGDIIGPFGSTFGVALGVYQVSGTLKGFDSLAKPFVIGTYGFHLGPVEVGGSRIANSTGVLGKITLGGSIVNPLGAGVALINFRGAKFKLDKKGDCGR